jgi:hypothetical protein
MAFVGGCEKPHVALIDLIFCKSRLWASLQAHTSPNCSQGKAGARAVYEFLGELGALADLVAQAKVADWAEFFANKLENGASRSPANFGAL